MKTGQEPIRLTYYKGVFRLEAHLLVSVSKAYQSRTDYYKQLVRSGIQDKWHKSFPVDDQMAEAILRFLKARCPESVPDFVSDLSQLQAEALASYQTRAAAQLGDYLAALKQGRASLANGAKSKLDQADLLARMSLDIFVSEENNPGRIPLVRFAHRVLQGGRRPLLIYVKGLKYRPSHVQSSFLRRGWGIFRDGHVISLGFNWHYRWPGLIRLAGSRSAPVFKREAAHEFGHTMGLADAYVVWYRSYEAYPGSENYLMHSNRELSPEEIRMMFQAQASGRLQHFPYKWSWEKFRQGFRCELRRRVEKMAENRECKK